MPVADLLNSQLTCSRREVRRKRGGGGEKGEGNRKSLRKEGKEEGQK